MKILSHLAITAEPPGHVWPLFRPYPWPLGVRAMDFKQDQIADSTIMKGFGASQGVFREYYFKNPPFKGNQLVASIGLLVVVRHAQPNLFALE